MKDTMFRNAFCTTFGSDICCILRTIIIPYMYQDMPGALVSDFTLGRANLWLTNEHFLYHDDSPADEIAIFQVKPFSWWKSVRAPLNKRYCSRLKQSINSLGACRVEVPPFLIYVNPPLYSFHRRQPAYFIQRVQYNCAKIAINAFLWIMENVNIEELMFSWLHFCD